MGAALQGSPFFAIALQLALSPLMTNSTVYRLRARSHSRRCHPNYLTVRRSLVFLMVQADQFLDAKVVRIGRSATERHQVAKVSTPMDCTGTRHVCLESLRIE